MRWGVDLGTSEGVVPVVGGWGEAFDGRMPEDHIAAGGVSGEVGVEAAEDFVAAGK